MSESPPVVMLARLFPPEYTGAGLQAARLAERLVTGGQSVEVITLHRSGWRVRRDHLGSVRVLRGPGLQLASRYQRVALCVTLLGRLARADRRAVIVHLHGFAAMLRPLGALKAIVGFRVLYKPTMAGADDARGIAQTFGPAALRAVDHWACTTEEILSAALEMGVPSDRLSLIPNGVDLERFVVNAPSRRVSVRRDLGVRDRSTIWMTVGAVIPRKRMELLVDAWAEIDDEDAQLWVVGPEHQDPVTALPTAGPSAYARALRERAREHGLGDRVRFLGERPDVPELLAAADGFLFASRQEGSPNAVLEALAAGLPVVATAFPSSAELQRLVGERLVIADPSPRRIADGVLGAVRRDGFPPQLRSYDLARVAERYVEVYSRMASS